MSERFGLELGDGPDAVALLRGGKVPVTRAELRARADQLLAELTQRGARRVLVSSEDPEQILAAIDACDRARADLWVAHSSLPSAHIDDICAEFAIQVRLGDAGDGVRHREESREQVPSTAAVTGPNVHMMTSGTTGRPKIAVHRLESLLGRVRSAAANPVNREGRWLLTYQTTGFAGVQVLLTAALSRSVLAVPEERTPSGFYQAARAGAVRQISGTPTFWRSFLMVAERGALDLKQITIGGEAVDQPTLDRVKSAFPGARVTHIYASTEAGAVFAVNDGLAGFPKAWLEQPNQGVSLRVRDGFLQIKSPHIMRAYASETSQPLLEDGWLATADECETVGDRVMILGRKDSTINVGGSKVYPLTIEAALLALPEVIEARAFGVSNPISGNLVAAEVVIAPGLDKEQARTTILQQCRAQLEKHQVPRVLKVVDSIVVRESGKKG